MSNSITTEIISMFTVPIQISELKLNIDSLIEFCYEMKRKDEIGVCLSNVKGWQSNSIINETHTEFVKLKNEIKEAANIFHNHIQFKKTHHQKIGNIWVNINEKGHSNKFHNHLGAILTGVFYLTKGTASVIFEHPYKDINTFHPADPLSGIWHSETIEKWNNINTRSWSMSPKPNTLLLFPPWIQHAVELNEENADRISISFNMGIHKKGQQQKKYDDHFPISLVNEVLS